MSEIAIACDGISKQFDGVPVLTGIDAKFHFAAVTVLAGENGAGKSTLFKIIAGQLAPGGGQLRLFGETVTHFSFRHLIVGLADDGLGVLLASSDMNELMNLSHRVLVFRQGAIVAELDRENLHQETVLRLAMGISTN
jgi:ABC-type sugar transport system ATPase subunit